MGGRWDDPPRERERELIKSLFKLEEREVLWAGGEDLLSICFKHLLGLPFIPITFCDVFIGML